MGGPYSQDFVEAVRSAAEISRVIGDYVPLKSAGARLKGLCPFHEEKTPSFSVDATAQLFYCFGCQTGGDVFKFVMQYENLGFGEAVEMLATRYGVPLPVSDRRAAGPADRVLAINRIAAAFYQKMLADPDGGKIGRAYCDKRELSEETRDRLALGFAPDAWELLGRHLATKGVKPEEAREAGLAAQRKGGNGQYDRFRNRLIFPIRDVNGRIIAFGGRDLGDSEAKYINSPETPAYTKGEHLYGLDQAREAIRREGFVIIVEGYLDLAAVLRTGLQNVVASLGTAFTPAQARLLARYSQRVVMSYDGDAAGTKAARKSLDLLLEKGFEVRMVELPPGCDPDDCIRSEGADSYARRVREAPEYLEFVLHAEARSRNLDRIEEKVAAVNAVLPHLAKLSNAIERASWATRMADELRIEEGLVLQELRTALRSAESHIRQRPDAPRMLRDVDARLVSQLLRSADERRRCAEQLDPKDIQRSPAAPIVDAILRLTREGVEVDYPAVLGALDGDPAAADLLTRIAFQDMPDEGPTVDDCLWTYRRENLNRRGHEAVRELGRLQKQPKDSAASADVNQRLLQLQELARQRDAL